MNFIKYDPMTDLGYIAGNALGQGLGLLYDNRLARGVAKNTDIEMADDKANEYQGYGTQLEQISKLDGDDFNSAVNQMYARGYQGPLVTKDNASKLSSGFLSDSEYMRGLRERNKGKRLHDESYQNYNQAMSLRPSLKTGLLG